MNKKLYVGNISYGTTEEDLKQLFGQFGDLDSVQVITDRATGQSKGFAFVEYAKDEDAEKALELDGQEVDGRQMRVSEARPPRERF